MKFLHTADLQIGARFSQFGEQAEFLRNIRLATLGRILNIAHDRNLDVVLIAGDTFESNQVADSLVREVFEILEAHPDVPIVILPGNHDPFDGPGCIWSRRPFNQPPDHVTVCSSRDALDVGEAVILPIPITQKISTQDPSYPLIELATGISTDRIKVGMTHGSLAIEGKHQPHDHPIALDAATRARLDYLAVGHWHKPQVYDDGRLVMPGTPEPDQFGQGAGVVLIVDLAEPGAKPIIEQVETCMMSWQEVGIEVSGSTEPSERVADALANIDSASHETILRIELRGLVDPVQKSLLLAECKKASERFAITQIRDRTSMRLSESLWQAWQMDHPLLAQATSDIQQARALYTGLPPDLFAKEVQSLTQKEFQTICLQVGLDPSALPSGIFESMMTLLIDEVSAQAGREADS